MVSEKTIQNFLRKGGFLPRIDDDNEDHIEEEPLIPEDITIQLNSMSGWKLMRTCEHVWR